LPIGDWRLAIDGLLIAGLAIDGLMIGDWAPILNRQSVNHQSINLQSVDRQAAIGSRQ
jgi:hypothetical protein